MKHFTSAFLVAAIVSFSLNATKMEFSIPSLYAKMSVATNDPYQKNILRDLACNCDNDDFEVIFQFSTKPNCMWKHIQSEITTKVPYRFMPTEEAMELYFVQELGLNNAAQIIDGFVYYINLQDEDGKTPVDIVDEKVKNSGNPMCRELQKGWKNTLQKLAAEKELQEIAQKVDAVDAQIEQNS